MADKGIDMKSIRRGLENNPPYVDYDLEWVTEAGQYEVGQSVEAGHYEMGGR